MARLMIWDAIAPIIWRHRNGKISRNCFRWFDFLQTRVVKLSASNMNPYLWVIYLRNFEKKKILSQDA